MVNRLPTVHADLYVEVGYACRAPLCPCHGARVQIKARAHDEDLMSFVNRARTAVYIDHLNNSNGCRALMADIKMPVDRKGVVGRPVPT